MTKSFAPWLAGLALLGALTSHAAEKWTDLFDGKTLNGWVQRGGAAKYRVENGQIIGTTVPKTPNTFLCTDKTYGDFILELEFKVDPKMNSGIQFRSNVYGEDTTLDLLDPKGKPYKISAGRVHGYQCEIDPSDRAWSAGIYDEGRRGWLNDLKNNPKAQKAFKQNAWNKVRIEAVGDSLKTFLNGVAAADLKDSLTPEGFISLQVHGIANNVTNMMEVAWRNIRIQDLDAPKRTAIFNGKNLDGWTSADGKPVTAGWEAHDGVLIRESKGGDIYTAKEYGDFDFRFEWKVADASNSGVKYRMAQYGKSWLGPEYQVMDDDKHPDAKLREGRRTAGGLYDLYVPNKSKILKPVGEWNCSRIVAKGSQIEHWLNGSLVVKYDTASDDFKTQVAGSKFAKTPTFNQNTSGRIQLQDHNDPVWFRNLTVQDPK